MRTTTVRNRIIQPTLCANHLPGKPALYRNPFTEAASASEELNAQAQKMKSYVADLSEVVGGVSTVQAVHQSESADPRILSSGIQPSEKHKTP